MAGHMCHGEGAGRGIECTGDNNSRDMVYRHHIHGVIDVWHSPKLRAAFDHADKEVVGVCY